MRLSLLIFLSLLAFSYCGSKYFMGEQGESCNQVCYAQKMNCNPAIITNNRSTLFDDLGVKCVKNDAAWYNEDQPSFVSDHHNKLYGNCMGYTNVPAAGQCSASNSSVQRLCRCDDVSDAPATFGTGFSNGEISTEEKWIFQHFVAPGDVGVLTHVWITYPVFLDPGVRVRYYIDGETTASIEYSPPVACGVGFGNQQAPWGNKYFGKAANDSGWYHDFKIPFQKSIVVTLQHLTTTNGRYFMIVRGSTNVPIILGGRTLPRDAKMNLHKIEEPIKALAWVPLIDVPSGPGAHFMLTLAVESGTSQSVDGCIHAYIDGQDEFPGLLIGTGTEDYFDSSWFFNGGLYHFPNAGATYLDKNLDKKAKTLKWAAYRFHDNDPLIWKNGFRLIWRNGDRHDSLRMRCHMMDSGVIHGKTTVAEVTSYAWYYTWPGPFDWRIVYSIAFGALIALAFLTIAIGIAVKYRKSIPPFIQKLLRKSNLIKYTNLNDSRELTETKEAVQKSPYSPISPVSPTSAQSEHAKII